MCLNWKHFLYVRPVWCLKILSDAFLSSAPCLHFVYMTVEDGGRDLFCFMGRISE